MIPISDDNPGERPPLVTWVAMVACIAVFIWQWNLGPAEDAAIYRYGFTPAVLFGGLNGSGGAIVSSWAPITLVTSMFLHGGLLHLGGNMLYLWIFGNNVEDAMGHLRYLAFYIACGALAALTLGVTQPGSRIPMIGASGAISGVLAAYVLIFPRARVTVIVPLGILLYPLKISAFYVVGFWFLLQLLSAAISNPNEPGVAWWAHVGGFGAGLILTPFLSRFPLFGRRRRGPWG